MKRILLSFGSVFALLGLLWSFDQSFGQERPGAGKTGSAAAGASHTPAPEDIPEGWQTASPREELRPQFSARPNGGSDGNGSLVIQADAREGLDGYWTKTFPVKGGQYYRFRALRKTEHVASPRRSTVARLLWQDDSSKSVLTEEQVVSDVLPGFDRVAEPEYPADKATGAHGWTEVVGVYRAPSKATRAVVELHLQWAPNGKVEWSDIVLAETGAPPGRKVRLATVHYRPKGGKSPVDNCREFAPPDRRCSQTAS